jgi:hypothetical protein
MFVSWLALSFSRTISSKISIYILHTHEYTHIHTKRRFLAWLVWLPPEQSDPRYAYMTGVQSTNFWFQFKKVHFVKCLYMLCDFHFMGISFMTAVNIVALLLTHEGSKLLLVVRTPCDAVNL